jgi:dihydroneopterin aldolase
MGTIRVENIVCYSYHGCMAEEASIGQAYLVDVEMKLDFSEAANNDDLSKTIDYCDINRIVEEEMAIRSKLIEHVGQRILSRFKKELLIMESATVEIKKINPPINGNVESVSVLLSI